jgi:hypothetical protein
MTVGLTACAAANASGCVRLQFVKGCRASVDYLLNTHQSCAAASKNLWIRREGGNGGGVVRSLQGSNRSTNLVPFFAFGLRFLRTQSEEEVSPEIGRMRLCLLEEANANNCRSRERRREREAGRQVRLKSCSSNWKRVVWKVDGINASPAITSRACWDIRTNASATQPICENDERQGKGCRA